MPNGDGSGSVELEDRSRRKLDSKLGSSADCQLTTPPIASVELTPIASVKLTAPPIASSMGQRQPSMGGSVQEQLLRSIEKQFQGGLVSKARRPLYHSTLGRE